MSAVPAGDSKLDATGSGSNRMAGALGERGLARLLGHTLALVFALPLVSGACPTPSGTRMGTHRPLGMPPFGFFLVTGRPCMTGGMTTSGSLAAHGRLIESARVQPAGAILSIVLASGLFAGLHALASGCSLRPLLDGATHRRTLIAAAVILGVSWGYKVWLEAGPPSPRLEAR